MNSQLIFLTHFPSKCAFTVIETSRVARFILHFIVERHLDDVFSFLCVSLLPSSRTAQMSCFSQSLRRTSPVHSGGGRNKLVLSKPPRVNGWSWPPQVFQVVGWLLYGYLAVVGFGVYIPLLPLPWSHVLYAVSLLPPNRSRLFAVESESLRLEV